MTLSYLTTHQFTYM